MMKKGISVLLLFLMIFSLVGCGAEKKWQEKYDEGVLALAANDYDLAFSSFNDAISILPDRAEAYYKRACSYMQLSENLTAPVQCLAAFSTDAEKVAFCHQQAIADYETSISLLPENAESYNGLLQVLLQEGDLAQFLYYADLKFSNTEDPGFQDAYDAVVDIRQGAEELMDFDAETSPAEYFIAILSEKITPAYAVISRFTDQPVYWEADTKTMGIYPVKSAIFGDYMLYWGSYENNLRNGPAVWLGASGEEYFCASGTWTDDIPSGHFDLKEWNRSISSNYTCRGISGNMENGLWSGLTTWSFFKNDDCMDSWTVEFLDGHLADVTGDFVDPRTGTAYYRVIVTNPDGSTKERMFTQNNAATRGLVGYASLWD